MRSVQARERNAEPSRRREWIVSPETPRWFHRSYRQYYYKGPPGPPVCLGEDLDAAVAEYKRLVARWRSQRRRELLLAWAIETARPAPAWAPALLAGPFYSRGRTSAIERGIAWSLTRDQVLRLLTDCHGVCAISGLPFARESMTLRGVSPWMPTLDRIDATRGYGLCG